MQRAESIRQAEMDRAVRSLGELSPRQKQSIDAMTRAIIKKVLHPGLQSSRSWAEDGDQLRLEAALQALGVTPDKSDPS